MKKLALTLAIVLGLGMASYADGGGLFGYGQAMDNNTTNSSRTESPLFPSLPNQHDLPGNQPAPVGSGIAVLIGLGAAYAFAKKREE